MSLLMSLRLVLSPDLLIKDFVNDFVNDLFNDLFNDFFNDLCHFDLCHHQPVNIHH